MKKSYFILTVLMLLFVISAFPGGYCDGCSFMKSHEEKRLKRPESLKLKYSTYTTRKFAGYVDRESAAPFDSFTSPTQQAIILFDGKKESLTIEVAPLPEPEFAWVVPVPSYPEVKEADGDMFNKMFNRVFYLLFGKFEPVEYLHYMGLTAKGDEDEAGKNKLPPPIMVHERKTVGKFDTAILSATDPSALQNWLKENGYYFPPEGKDALDYYITKKWFFVAMKVSNPEKAEALHPVEFIFDSDKPVYPMKLTSIQAGTSKVNLYVFADREMGAKGLFRVWNGSSSSLNAPSHYPYYATVLTFSVKNDKIEGDIELIPSSATVIALPVTSSQALAVLAGFIILYLAFSTMVYREKGVFAGDSGDEKPVTDVWLRKVLPGNRGKVRLKAPSMTAITIATLAILFLISFLKVTDVEYQEEYDKCLLNAKKIGTAMEMYSTDNSGHYPRELSMLTPEHLKTIPTCGFSGSDSYSEGYEVMHKPWDAYTFFCFNRHYRMNNDNYLPVVFPPCDEFKVVFMDSTNIPTKNTAIMFREISQKIIVAIIILIIVIIIVFPIIDFLMTPMDNGSCKS